MRFINRHPGPGGRWLLALLPLILLVAVYAVTSSLIHYQLKRTNRAVYLVALGVWLELLFFALR